MMMITMWCIITWHDIIFFVLLAVMLLGNMPFRHLRWTVFYFPYNIQHHRSHHHIPQIYILNYVVCVIRGIGKCHTIILFVLLGMNRIGSRLNAICIFCWESCVSRWHSFPFSLKIQFLEVSHIVTHALYLI